MAETNHSGATDPQLEPRDRAAVLDPSPRGYDQRDVQGLQSGERPLGSPGDSAVEQRGAHDFATDCDPAERHADTYGHTWCHGNAYAWYDANGNARVSYCVAHADCNAHTWYDTYGTRVQRERDRQRDHRDPPSEL